jgi:hypothetical protein
MSSRPLVADSSELGFGLLYFIRFKFTQLGLLLIWVMLANHFYFSVIVYKITGSYKEEIKILVRAFICA